MMHPAPSNLERHVLDKLARLRHEADVVRQVSAAKRPAMQPSTLRGLARWLARRRFRSRSRRRIVAAG